MSQDNVASVMTTLRAGRCGAQFQECTRHFLVSKMSIDWFWNPPSLLLNGYLGGFFAWW